MEETAMRGMSLPRLVSDADGPAYARIDRVPALVPAGMTVSLTLASARPGDPRRTAQVALACAEHAAGWSIGLDATGRVSLVLSTRRGPVAVTTARAVEVHRRYRVVARIPGEPGRLEVSVRPEGSAEAQIDSAGVRVGAPGVASRGPLLWGCRSLFDGVRPELPFDGVVGGVVLDAGAAAMSWADETVVGFPA